MKKRNGRIRRCRFGTSTGFSLLEMIVAMAVMAIALVGGLTMVTIGIGRNGSMRMDTTAANVAQTVLEEISSVKPNSDPTLTIKDCAGNPISINTAVGGPTPLSNGDIDFSAATKPGYNASYVMCAANNGMRITYDVRWSIASVAKVGTTNWGKLVTVAAQQPATVTNAGIRYSPPVTLRTVVGM